MSWSPYAVVSLWAAFGNPNDISVLAGTLPAVLAKSSIIWNPIIYVATNKQFRHGFFAIIPCSGLKEALMKKEQQMEKEDSDEGDDGATVAGPNATHIQVQPANVVAPTGAEAETFGRSETVVEDLDLGDDKTKVKTVEVKPKTETEM